MTDICYFVYVWTSNHNNDETIDGQYQAVRLDNIKTDIVQRASNNVEKLSYICAGQ